MPIRRLVTIPAFIVGWLVWVGTAPVWVPAAALVDLVRGRRGIALRSGALVAAYLSCELAGIVASGALWSWRRVRGIDEDRWLDLHFRLEAWWGATLWRAVVWTFGLRVEVEGDEDLARGPYLLLLRHASSGDTLLAAALVSRRHGMRLRYVLKRELLWDPCLDIVGNRLPNVFVDRNSSDASREVERVRALAHGLGPRDGVLVYPEGTRFSPRRRLRVLERYAEAKDEGRLAYAQSLSRVLPPRPGGTLGVLEAAPSADVVICAHTGFEGAASLARVWGGDLLHKTIRIEFRRIRRSAIPHESSERVAWLLDEWKRVDAWVERNAAREGAFAT